MVNLFLRSVLVLALLFGLVFAIGMAVIYVAGLPPWVTVLFALAVVGLQYLAGPFILQLIYKIKWADPADVDPALAALLAEACAKRKIPVPRFGIIEDGNPNAFTFGHYPGNARLVVTRGLLTILDPEEVQAVVGHELGHIAHWDFVVMTLAAAVPLVLYVLFATSRAVAGGNGNSRDRGQVAAIALAVALVSYVVSQYIVLLLSRVREYFADRFAREVTGDPDKLDGSTDRTPGLQAGPAATNPDLEVNQTSRGSGGLDRAC
jgi:Zn-dependent protease with chaperone function